MSEQKFKSFFDKAVENLEQKTGKTLTEHIIEEITDLPERLERYKAEGIKDIITLPHKEMTEFLNAKRLKEQGRGLSGHPRLGMTNVGDTVIVIGQDAMGKRIEKKAKVISMKHPYKKDFRVDWEIELIEE